MQDLRQPSSLSGGIRRDAGDHAFHLLPGGGASAALQAGANLLPDAGDRRSGRYAECARPELYFTLRSVRETVLRLVQDRSRPIRDRLSLALLLCQKVQKRIDMRSLAAVSKLCAQFSARSEQERLASAAAPLPPPERRLFPGVAASAEHGASDGGVPGAARALRA